MSQIMNIVSGLGISLSLGCSHLVGLCIERSKQ